MDERDVLRAWRQLFQGNEITAETLAEAESLLDGLSGESPLHLRLASELDELQKRQSGTVKKRTARRS